MNFPHASPLPLIKNIVIGETIGHGSFAFVKTAKLKIDPSSVIAVKFVHLPNCRKFGLSDNEITKEAVIHSKCSNNVNVLKIIDCNISKDYLWIAMEMADGGELFDKIEPDIGVDIEVARFYYQQLVRAITYLHDVCGVAHRDIKPENILLDKDGNLKVADFGLAFQFRRKDGSKRVVKDKKGSPPYMAPEIVYREKYFPDATDIWSIGILIFILLTGETPWEFPSEDDLQFKQFLLGHGNLNDGPWNKIDFVELNLLRKILQPEPEYRATLKQLRDHPWFNMKVEFSGPDGMCKNSKLLAEKLFSNLKVSLSDSDFLKSTQDRLYIDRNHRTFYTQPIHSCTAQLIHDPLPYGNLSVSQSNLTQYSNDNDISMTQEMLRSIYITQDIANIQFLTEELRIIPSFNPNKLTRFYSIKNISEILHHIELALSQSGIEVKSDFCKKFVELQSVLGYDGIFPVAIDIRTKDRKGWSMTGIVIISEVQNNLKIIRFERKIGNPLEWRRLFKQITLLCRNIVFI